MYHEEHRRATIKTDQRKLFTWTNFTGHVEPMRWSMLALLLLSCSQTFAQRPGDICPQNPEHEQDVITNPIPVPTLDPKLFNKRRYRSPRVIFSEQPPDSEPAGHQTRSRTKRKAGSPHHRGVYSVCESVSNWEGNKTKATDISGNEVTVLPDVIINNAKKKQYFFETTCSSARTGGSSCLGIDARHWNSYCTNSHTFVRALTSFKNLVAWRLIRINVACVCVLSRKSWRQ